MNDNSKNLLMFVLGAAVGVAVGYYLATEDKEQLIENIKEKVHKAKSDLEGQIERGKKVVQDIKKKANDLMGDADLS